MSTQHTVLMDRSRSRVSPRAPLATVTAPPPGTEVFYTGSKYHKKIGIASGRTGIVDCAPVPGTGKISVSFARIPPAPKPGEDPGEGELDKSPEAFTLHPYNVRPVPSAALAKKAEARKVTAASRQK